MATGVAEKARPTFSSAPYGSASVLHAMSEKSDIRLATCLQKFIVRLSTSFGVKPLMDDLCAHLLRGEDDQMSSKALPGCRKGFSFQRK